MKVNNSWKNKMKEANRQEKLQIMWNVFNKVVNSGTVNKITQSIDLEKDFKKISDMFIQECRTYKIEKYIILTSKPYNVLKKLIHCNNYERVGLIVSQLQRCGSKHTE